MEIESEKEIIQASSILMPKMGEGDMPDTQALIKIFENNGISFSTIDLSKPRAFQNIDWGNVDVVDLRNMRGSLTNFERYIGIVRRILEKIEAQKRVGHHIEVIPKYNEIEWIAYKSNYLEHIKSCGIETIPTQIIKRHSSEYRNSFEDPDNLEKAINDCTSYIENSSNNIFALKPSVSALAKRLYFIKKNPDRSYTVEYPLEGNKIDTFEYSNKTKLKAFLRQYLIETPSQNETFLLQEYVDNIETSAVFINGKIHFVRRLYAEAKIAHKRYGGKDQIIRENDVDPKLISFVKKVYMALPKYIQEAHFFRIDVMWDKDNHKYILSEIEGAGATRLWLEESGRAEDYANMIMQYVLDDEFSVFKKKISQKKFAAQ